MKVWPKNDAMRKVLKHGVTAFPAEGPADWPDDTFTHRRIEDGDVTVEDPNKKSATMTPHLKAEMAVGVSRKEFDEKSKPDVGKA